MATRYGATSSSTRTSVNIFFKVKIFSSTSSSSSGNGTFRPYESRRDEAVVVHDLNVEASPNWLLKNSLSDCVYQWGGVHWPNAKIFMNFSNTDWFFLSYIVLKHSWCQAIFELQELLILDTIFCTKWKTMADPSPLWGAMTFPHVYKKKYIFLKMKHPLCHASIWNLYKIFFTKWKTSLKKSDFSSKPDNVCWRTPALFRGR